MSTKRGIQKDNNIKVEVRTLDDFGDYIQEMIDRTQFNGVILNDVEGNPIIFAVVKGVHEDLNNHVKQTRRYFSYEESCKIANLTFLKNNFEWFSCTTHEEFGGFSISSEYYRKLFDQITGLKIEKVE